MISVPVTFPLSSHLHEMSDVFYSLGDKERTEILTNACYAIEKKLADMDFLEQFNHMGKQAFYNDDPHGESVREHLKDNFYCAFNMDETNLYLYNTKTVTARGGSQINLFEQLLWNPFGRYRVPTSLRSPTKEDILKGSKGFHKRFYKTGEYLMETEFNKMSFYYRYMGKTFYNLVERRGIDSGLHTKFKSYITKAVEGGLQEAITDFVGPEEKELAGGE